MSFYTVMWLSWIALFFAIEGSALFRKSYGDTLTAHLVKWFSLKDKSWGWRWRRIALVSMLAWLNLHLLTGWV